MLKSIAERREMWILRTGRGHTTGSVREKLVSMEKSNNWNSLELDTGLTWFKGGLRREVHQEEEEVEWSGAGGS